MFGRVTDFTLNSASELTFIAPEGSAGAVDVVAVTGERESVPVRFTVLANAAPVIALFLDASRLTK